VGTSDIFKYNFLYKLPNKEDNMRKKAQGMSINVIIIAAIGLAVLVVLFAIFTGRLNIFSLGISKTASCENACKAQAKGFGTESNDAACRADSTGTRTYVPGKYDDVPAGGACCCVPSFN